jgi:CRISPR-associated protein Csb2
MSLVLEIEYLTGVVFAAVRPDSDAVDWPPQPDRVFSALVATWAARGKLEEEAAALRWLEGLAEPRIQASPAPERTARLSFVPANDATLRKQKHAENVLPLLRNRQPRRFPSARPYDPLVRFCWSAAPAGEATMAALQALASDTAYIGHSASLTRCRFLDLDAPSDSAGAAPARAVYPGRLHELESAFARGRRPHRGAWVRSRAEPPAETPDTVFATRWLILEPVDETDLPDIRASAMATKAIRDLIIAGYERAGLRAPETVTGRVADGSPTQSPHLAIVPLPFAGFPHADGHLLGFALIPPRGTALLEDEDFVKALRAIAPARPKDGRRVVEVEVTGSAGAVTVLKLSPTYEPSRASLAPGGYVHFGDRPWSVFATVTPIVLDRFPKASGVGRLAEMARIVAAACGHIGLPEPQAIETELGLQPAVIVDKHSAIEGVPPAYPSAASPPWMGWRLPRALAGRALTHAVIRFPRPLTGPVILGAGRYVGLGLCKPIPDPEATR